jgi:hypothetical protein
MRKYLLLSLALIFCTSCALATGNPSDKYKKNITYPSTPSYTRTGTSAKTNVNTRTTTTSTSSSPLATEAKKILNAAISRNSSAWDSAMQKMIDKGGIPGDSNVISKCPRNPKIPTITVNGKTLKGNTCAKMTYTYKGKSYEEGFCR